MKIRRILQRLASTSRSEAKTGKVTVIRSPGSALTAEINPPCATAASLASASPSPTSLCAKLGISNHVRLVPLTANVADYLQIMGLLVFPSSFIESQPNVIMEGMSMGLPVIGSDIGGIPELLPDDCLFDPADTRALGAKLVELATRPETLRRLAEENLAKRRRFTLEKRLDAVTALYSGALMELRPARDGAAVPA